MGYRNDIFLGGRVTTELFLVTLNRQRNFKREREHFRSLDGSIPDLDEAFDIISDALPSHLARHTDAWITSGRNVQQVWEQPRVRKLDFKGLNRIKGWLNLQQSSTITVSEQNGKISLNLSDFAYEGLPIAEPEEYAEEEAARMFLWLLNEQELRYAIAKCDECGRFYFRLKPRAFYKRATFCADCRHKASVRRRMREVRKQKEQVVIEAAIVAYEKWHQLSPRARAKFGEESSYITKQIGKRFGVTGNWLTRHQHEILRKRSPPNSSKISASGRTEK
jgi:hypothetical protein